MWRARLVRVGRAAILAVGLLVGSGGTVAEAVCTPTPTNVLQSMLAGVCWSCFFPISLASVNINPAIEDYTSPAVGPGVPFPTPNPYPPPVLCSCLCVQIAGVPICLPGLPLGYWEPKNLLEVVHEPFCFPSLGIPLGPPASLVGGAAANNDVDTPQLGSTFWHVHYLAFPVFFLAGLLIDSLCLNPTGALDDVDVLYLSELDPTWNHDELAALLFPEVVLVNNPIAQLACAADAVTATAGFPLDPLFWCAGSWGSLYPPTGNIAGKSEDLKTAALAWARLLHKLARVGMELYTAGNALMLCWDFPTGVIVKSQYKMQLVWPVPNVQPLCCSPIGRMTPMWAMFKTIPGYGENHVFLLWKLQRCCFL
jgi:conjugal transfer pilus assembly protein TraU